jgi:hypothetical protein
MRRGRAIALSLLVLAGAVTLLYLLMRSGPQSAVQRAALAGDSRRAGLPAIAGSSMSAPLRGQADVPRTADTAHSFNHRVHCVQVRLLYGRLAPPDALAPLCEGKLSSALKILAPLAEAGDRHAIKVLFRMQIECHDWKPSPISNRPLMVALAQKNGASSETVQRLDDLLAEEEHGPTADELEGCRQIATETMKLEPAVARQFTDTLGREVTMGRGPAAREVQIEYDRKMLIRGDAGQPGRGHDTSARCRRELAVGKDHPRHLLAQRLPDTRTRPNRGASAAHGCCIGGRLACLAVSRRPLSATPGASSCSG